LVCLQHEYGIFGGNAGSHVPFFVSRTSTSESSCNRSPRAPIALL
jgi:hypothetical protein